MAAAIVPDRSANVLWHALYVANQFFGGFVLQLWVFLQRVIQISDVSCMMFVMMQRHSLRINIRLERRIVVWERRNFVRHCFLLVFLSIYRRLRRATAN